MTTHNLLVLSDVHLGSDLIHWAQPNAPKRAHFSKKRDDDLVALLNWYNANRRDQRPWRLVIAGDFVDFVGMSIAAEAREYSTPLNAEEQAHGLGGAVDHAILKLRRVVEHHAVVFETLAHFIAAGNTLVVLRGNHDVDLHWEAVQQEFVGALMRYATIPRDKVEFLPWFYYEKDLVYIEHGHQYDALCSSENLLHPVSPRDPRRTLLSFADVLLRYIVRPTRGMTEGGHSDATFAYYLRFAWRLGLREMMNLGRRFGRAVLALVGLWHDHFSEATAWVRQEHERKMHLLGLAKQISLQRLQSLARLQRPPVTRSLLALLASVMLDRVVIGLMAIVLGALLVVLAPTWWYAALAVLGAAGCVYVAALAWRRLRGAIDPSRELRERAPRVASLFPAAFVVMGHTHLPELRQTSAGTTTYVNLGTWAEDETEDGAPPALPATRTHLVVIPSSHSATAELLTWDAATGPQRFAAPAERNWATSS